MRELDLRGLRCPLPALRTRRCLADLAAGERVAVLCDDPLAAIDIPHLCREEGHALEAEETQGTAKRFVVMVKTADGL
ncbi:sulfurtransferase TusA family protein [Jiella marina]|uniref:sulfurtransferase TusA family protein n=1 Tax=Jiella sp. LLJ827 TaxID=2917712 RepID=UPI0021009FE2|nr:sulfurtransferase TusA family protein [Jiella sp. LLJ827]MCQ0987405.1 sulfurtransferase TusA family protein [Jiella sp. LLJ827]